MMKAFICTLLFTASLYAETLTLDNQTSYPDKSSKIAIQWAQSAREVDQENKALMNNSRLNQKNLASIAKTGKIQLNVPDTAQYFRILVWSKGKKEPEFTTNWIDLTAGKTYTLQKEFLIPVVLMPGIGC